MLHRAPGFVWVNKAEIAALAAAVRLEPEEFQRRYVRKVGIRQSLIELPGGDCVFFHRESGSCQVYQQRPRQCRTWPFWDSNLATPAAWREMCAVVRAAIAGRSSRSGRSAPAWMSSTCELTVAPRHPTIAGRRLQRLGLRRLLLKRRLR